jgi:HlyD family secretion protein
VVSTEELEKSRAQYLQSELSRENMKSTLNNMRIQIGQLKESLLDTRHQDTETLNQLQTSLQTLENQLKTAIEEWELTYVLKAPIDGKVTFTSYWTVNQNVTAGSEVFAVVLIPGSSSFFIGKALLPIARSGKVKEGQRVNIHLDNFPDTEFGTLKGTVKNISKVAVKEANGVYYTVEIALPDGLKTTYRKELPNLPDLQGHADIVTEDVSLLERFFLPIKKILRENN